VKNHQYIRQLSVKKLAKMLVRSEEVNEADEGMDGEWYDLYITHYVCPDGARCYDEEGAIQYTMDWLNAEMKDNI
jgi:hypothetical protein